MTRTERRLFELLRNLRARIVAARNQDRALSYYELSDWVARIDMALERPDPPCVAYDAAHDDLPFANEFDVGGEG